MEGNDGDLCRRHTGHTCTTRWVKAHLTCQEALAKGFPRADWEGNMRADEDAKAAAQARDLPRPVCEKRTATVSALAAAQRVIAAVSAAALEADPVRDARPRRKAKRKAANRALFARIKAATQAKKRTAPRPAAPPSAAPAQHPRLHVLAVDPGPAPPPPPSLAGTGVAVTARCTRCSKAWRHTRSWAKAAWELCPAQPHPEPGWQLVRGTHDLCKLDGGWRCARCHLTVASHHRAKQATHRCPVPCLRRPDGAVEHVATQHLRELVQTSTAWGSRAYPDKPQRGTKRTQPEAASAAAAPEGADPPDPPEPPRRRPAAPLRWLAHLAVTGGE